ncbi:hypothetical protein CCAN11_2480040 [Capnocytophaga canimorsus]|uniref:Uncharacterized protein n=1 Tax=Capnocytophaga canimorsus TaxID=28188 RepID=A0A0B7IPW4_9FLAO|nr:hypothetical protein CCAN11_2480040 [Capnocytophaga canimorsus]
MDPQMYHAGNDLISLKLLIANMNLFEKKYPTFGTAAYTIFGVESSIKYEGKTIENVFASVATSEISEIEDIKVEKGRLASESESNSGNPVIVLGHHIAKQLLKMKTP